MSLASKLLSVLAEFRTAVGEQVNSGQLVTIDDHIDRVASVIDSDVTAADAKAKEVLGELYTALHGAPAAPPVDAPAAPVAAPAPVVAPLPGSVVLTPPVEAAPVAEASAPVEVAASETPAS